MVETNPTPTSILAANQRSLKSLARAITLSQGQFSLVFAGCNYADLRTQVIQQLRDELPPEYNLPTVQLPKRVISLYSTLHNQIGDSQPQAIFIVGLEGVEKLDDFLRTLNHVRDEFRKRHQFPMVFWVNDGLLRKLRRIAPDFTSWAATPIRFEKTTEQLRSLLSHKTDDLFAKILDIYNSPPEVQAKHHPHSTLGQVWDYSSDEFRAAIRDLQARGIELEPELAASLAFVSGLDDYANDRIQEAVEHFLASLEFWQEGNHVPDSPGKFGKNKPGICPEAPPPIFDFDIINNPAYPHLLRTGTVLYYIGLCYYRQAERTNPDYRRCWEAAKSYFQRCLDVFETANRPDLMAQLIGQLAEVLQHLRQWDELEIVAQKSQNLHHTYGSPIHLACDCGFLAQVAVEKSRWVQATKLARVALWRINESIQQQNDTPKHQFPLLLAQVYRLLLAHALRNLGRETGDAEYTKQAEEQIQTAVAELNPALELSDFRYDVYRYIRLLRRLRSLYFDAGKYLEAFTIRQQRRSVEQQYGLRAFVGAGRLQPQYQVTNPVLGAPMSTGTVALEIIASGRQRDIDNLIGRISRADQKLTVIYGPSGVGKSSTVRAGLVPALQNRTIGDQFAIPIVVDVYTDWVRSLGEACAVVNPVILRSEIELSPPATPITKEGILERIRHNGENNMITVLIFDQFEEFFFAANPRKQIHEFDGFLRDCLNIPFVKVILSLREDYLHHLLEFKQVAALETINENILDKQILYPLKNFSREDAKKVIQQLTARQHFFSNQTHLYLAPELVDALVEDLSKELGEVRPIELQVVGAQLQDERIVSLSRYEQFRPNKLIERYISELIFDCGPENQRAAWLVLYLLTDENQKRTLKTRAQLATELAELEDVDKLEFILEILVRSGLVVLLPEVPERYQLIHDYLVELIRSFQQTELSFQERLKELRQQVAQQEAKIAQLSSSLRHSQQDKKQLTPVATPGNDLLTEIKELRKREETSRVEIERLHVELEQQKLQAELAETEKLRLNQDRMNRVLKTALTAAVVGIVVLSGSIGMAVYQWHKAVLSASIAASASSEALFALNKDIDALKEGLRAGRKLQQALFPDADSQQKVRSALYQAVYGTREREGNRLDGHRSGVNSLAFSPNGTMIASASNDYTVRLWRTDGKLLHTLEGHNLRVTSVAFHPSGRSLVSGGADKAVRIWNIDGKLLRVITTKDVVNAVAVSPDGDFIAGGGADNRIHIWRTNGELVKTLTGHGDIIRTVAWSKDGEILVSGDNQGTVKLWHRNGRELATLRGHSKGVLAVAWSGDGQTLASTGLDGTIRLWNQQGQPLQTLTGRGAITSVSFSPDGQTIASGSMDNTIKLWSLEGKLLETLRGHGTAVNSISFSNDGQTLASASEDGLIRLWQWKYVPLDKINAHAKAITKISFASDGKLFASASEDGLVKLWSGDRQLEREFAGHGGAVWDVSISPDGNRIASASSDRTVKIWSRDGRLLHTLSGHTDTVLSVAWSADGKTLASASKDRQVKLWSDKGELLHTLIGHGNAVNWVSFSPDGKLLASAGDDNTVIIWSANGQLMHKLPYHDRPVFGVAWSNNGKMLASASLDSSVKLWKPNANHIRTLRGTGESFLVVNFHPHNSSLLSLSEDRILLWEDNGKLQLIIKSDRNDLTTANFSADGKTLVTGSNNGTITFRHLDDSTVEHLLSRGCKLLHDYLRNSMRVSDSDRNLCPQQK